MILDDDGTPSMHLTAREIDVLQLVCTGLSSKQIAVRLGIAPRTVETYIEHVRLKMCASNRSHMAALAVAEQLIMVGGGEAR